MLPAGCKVCPSVDCTVRSHLFCLQEVESTAARQNSELAQEEQGGEVSQNISGFDSVNAFFGVLHESGFANLMKAKASEERRRRMSDDVC